MVLSEGGETLNQSCVRVCVCVSSQVNHIQKTEDGGGKTAIP